MSAYALVIAGGTVVTASDVFRGDVGISGGRIATVGLGLKGTKRIEADGLLVMPGGVDTHCHIEQLQENGGADEKGWTPTPPPRSLAVQPRSSPSPTSSRVRVCWRHSPNTIAAPRLARWWIIRSTRSSPMPRIR